MTTTDDADDEFMTQGCSIRFHHSIREIVSSKQSQLPDIKLQEIMYLFLKLNVWLCFGSAVMVVISALALSIPLSSVGIGLLLPLLLFYFIYVEDRRDISPEDWANHPYRTQLVQRYQNGLLLTEVTALLGYEAILLFLVQTHPSRGLLFFFFGQLPIVVLAVYGHLKQQPTLDSLAVGSTWAFVVVFTLMVSTTHVFSPETAAVFIGWFLIVFAGVESRNLEDVEGDREADRTTLAGYLGRKPTKALEVILKTVGVIAFWHLSGVLIAGMAVMYLLGLRSFRFLTRREERTASRRLDQTEQRG